MKGKKNFEKKKKKKKINLSKVNYDDRKKLLVYTHVLLQFRQYNEQVVFFFPGYKLTCMK